MQPVNRNCYVAVIDSPVGLLGIGLDDERVSAIDYLGHSRKTSVPRGLAAECARQLRAYFAEPGFVFDLPLALQGTEHQCRVWQALQRIKPGYTLSYGELAGRISSGARAVGNACRNNPVSIVVPCHRVVAATGLGGYSGAVGGVELDRKRWLLEHEAARSVRK